MKANCKVFGAMVPWKAYLLGLLVLCIGWLPVSGQSADEIDDVWQPLMEVSAVGYAKADSGRRSYQFFPLNVKGKVLTLEQSHQYSFVWDFGNGMYSVEPMPIMIFDRDVPSEVSCRVTAIKEVNDPLDEGRIVRPRTENCDAPLKITQELNLRRGRVERGSQPTIRIMEPPHMPVSGLCINYLVEVTMPEDARYSCVLEIDGFVENGLTGSKNALEILEIESDPEIIEVPSNTTSRRLRIPTSKDVTYHVLLHCKVGSQAAPKQSLHWKIKGTFEPVHARKDDRIVVNETRNDLLVGSLDPSSLECLNSYAVQTGEVTKWHVKMSNDGDSPEYLISVFDKLPTAFDLKKVKATRFVWGGKVMPLPRMEVKEERRQITWRLQGGPNDPLMPGEYADLYFEVPVTAKQPCPKRCRKGCIDRPSTLLTHNVYVEFSLEPGRPKHLISDDLRLLCGKGKMPKIITGKIRRHCLLKTTAILAGVAATSIVVEQVVSKKSRKTAWKRIKSLFE
jgi:hypothetical protein